MTPNSIDGLQCGVRSELNEVGGDKMQVEAIFTLTLHPQPQIQSQAITGRRRSSLYRSVPLRIRRIRESLEIPFFRRSSCERAIKTAPLQFHPFSPNSKSTPMNHQFPPEIVQLIVEASLDPYDMFTTSTDDSTTRYAILRSYSLLNSTWYGTSQSELVRSVELYTYESVDHFFELVRRRGGTIDGVRNLYISLEFDGDPSTLPKLLKSTPHLVNLQCHGGMMGFCDLAQLQRLRRLELFNVVVDGPPPSSVLCIPRLRRMETSGCLLGYPASHFFTPALLPRLRRIGIQADDPDSIAPLIQQLRIVTSEDGYGDYTLLSRATSLLLLPLPLYSQQRLAMFSNLPSLPPFLHIDFPSVRVNQIAQQVALALVELWEANKPGLRIILLNDHGIDDRVKSLIKRLKERGVRTQLVDMDMDFDDAIEEMYRIRAEEKRAAKDRAERGG